MTDCLFCKIVSGEVSAKKMDEDDHVVVFHDISPQAPTHLLIIPKEHISTIDDARPEHENLLGKMILKAQKMAQKLNLSQEGYRLVYNVNAGGGQMVYHIHLHLLGGRQMTWPPG